MEKAAPIPRADDAERSPAYYVEKPGCKNGFRWSGPEQRMPKAMADLDGHRVKVGGSSNEGAS